MKLNVWYNKGKHNLEFDAHDGLEVLHLQICSVFAIEECALSFDEKFVLLDVSGRIITNVKDILLLYDSEVCILESDYSVIELFICERKSVCSSILFPDEKFIQAGYRYLWLRSMWLI